MDNWKTSSSFNGKLTQRLQIPAISSLTSFVLSTPPTTAFTNWLADEGIELPTERSNIPKDSVMLPSRLGFLTYVPKKGDVNYRDPQATGPPTTVDYTATVFKDDPQIVRLGRPFTCFILDVVAHAFTEFDNEMCKKTVVSDMIKLVELYSSCELFGTSRPAQACLAQAALFFPTAETFRPYRIFIKYATPKMNSFFTVREINCDYLLSDEAGTIAAAVVQLPDVLATTDTVNGHEVVVKSFSPFTGLFRTRDGLSWRLGSRVARARTDDDTLNRLNQVGLGAGNAQPQASFAAGVPTTTASWLTHLANRSGISGNRLSEMYLARSSDRDDPWTQERMTAAITSYLDGIESADVLQLDL